MGLLRDGEIEFCVDLVPRCTTCFYCTSSYSTCKIGQLRSLVKGSFGEGFIIKNTSP